MVKIIFFICLILIILCCDQANAVNCYSCMGCSAGAMGRTRIFCPFGCYVMRASSSPFTIRYDQGCYDPRFESYTNMPNYLACFTNLCNTVSRLNSKNQSKNQKFSIGITIIGLSLYIINSKK